MTRTLSSGCKRRNINTLALLLFLYIYTQYMYIYYIYIYIYIYIYSIYSVYIYIYIYIYIYCTHSKYIYIYISLASSTSPCRVGRFQKQNYNLILTAARWRSYQKISHYSPIYHFPFLLSLVIDQICNNEVTIYIFVHWPLGFIDNTI